jgi:hypothetical protein
MDKNDWQDVKITPSERTKRNESGSKSESISISLPADTYDYIVKWARTNNVSVSRAIHDHIWYGYHAIKGDYQNFYPGVTKPVGDKTGHFVERLNDLDNNSTADKRK